MYALEHPDITNAIRTGYPCGHEPQPIYCERCGNDISDEEVFEDDEYEYLCVNCLMNKYEKEW